MTPRGLTSILLVIAITVSATSVIAELGIHYRLSANAARLAASEATQARIEARQKQIDAMQAQINDEITSIWLRGQSYVEPSPPGPFGELNRPLGVDTIKPCRQEDTLLPGESCMVEMHGRLPVPRFEGDRAMLAPKLDADRSAK